MAEMVGFGSWEAAVGALGADERTTALLVMFAKEVERASRARALEDAAKVCEELPYAPPAACDCADAIRALIAPKPEL